MDTFKPLFEDREDAGKKLAELLMDRNFENPIILALPRGGVPVAHEVARAFASSLDVVVTRKIGSPNDPEYGIGAISENEVPHFNTMTASFYEPNDPEVKEVVEIEKKELRRRIALYREGRSLPSMKNRTVILVDDGLATGVTAAAAGKFLRTFHPEELILAVPVGPRSISSMVQEQFDEIICLNSLEHFSSVGFWYYDFSQIEDSEVIRILHQYHPHDLSNITQMY